MRDEEDRAEDEERRRKLDREGERAGDEPRHHVRKIAEAGKPAGRKEIIAGDHPAQHQMVSVGEKDDEHAGDGEKGAGDRALLGEQRIEDLRRRQPELERDDHAGGLQRRQHHAPDRADEETNDDLAAKQRQ